MSDKEALSQLREVVEEQQKYIEMIERSPHSYAVVSMILDPHIYFTTISGARHMMDKKFAIVPMEVGQWIEITGDRDTPFKVIGSLPLGRTAEVTHLTPSLATVKLAEQTVELPYNPQLDLGIGDSVRIDPTNSVVLEVLEKAKAKAAPVLDKHVDWDEVGGQTEAKAELIEAVELPRKHPDLFARYGKRPPKGVLLYGPPGCGKTLLGKAVASSLTEDKSNPGCFIYVKGPEILNPYVGVSESNVRDLFLKARAYRAEHNTQAVIFIDEADALLGRRGKSHSTSGIEDTLVPMFLTEMDGLNESDVLVILATNRPDTLDPAVVRDGRIDRKIRVSRPTQADAEAIFGLYLSRIPCVEGTTVAQLAKDIAHDLYTIERAMFELMLDDGQTRAFGLQNLASGALIEGVVEKATALAIRRELLKIGTPGLSLEDLTRAVEQVYRQNLDVNHHDAMEDFALPHTIKSYRKVAHVA